MTHDEIRILLAFRDAPQKNCGEVNALLDEHIGHVARRIDELKAFARKVKELRGRVVQPEPRATAESCVR